MTALWTNTPKAARARWCDECGGPIAKGERYASAVVPCLERHPYYDDEPMCRSLTRVALHLACASLAPALPEPDPGLAPVLAV